MLMILGIQEITNNIAIDANVVENEKKQSIKLIIWWGYNLPSVFKMR